MGINQYIKIGTRIKEARLAKKIPQKEMAKRLSLSVSTYSNYENNYREPKLDLIHKICDELDTSLDELLGTSTMSPELINEASKYLLKDDVDYVKKESNKIFQKQLNDIELTEDFMEHTQNAIFSLKQSMENLVKTLKENHLPYYKLLNDDGKLEADKQIEKSVERATAQAKEQATEQIKLLTEIPKYRKNTGES